MLGSKLSALIVLPTARSLGLVSVPSCFLTGFLVGKEAALGSMLSALSVVIRALSAALSSCFFMLLHFMLLHSFMLSPTD